MFMKHFFIIMQTLQSRQSACHHFLSGQLYNSKTRVFLCCQFRPVGLFLIQTEHMRKPRHSWQDSSLKRLILTAQNKTPWACPQHIPAAPATKNPFRHLLGHATGTCNITLHRHLSKGLKLILWQLKIQNTLKNPNKTEFLWTDGPSKATKPVIMPQRH